MIRTVFKQKKPDEAGFAIGSLNTYPGFQDEATILSVQISAACNSID